MLSIKKVKFAFIPLSIVFVVSNLFAQDDSWKYEYYNTTNGLSQNTVYAIAQDSLGYMWFGTQEGLNRFDGKTFKIYRESPDKRKTIKGDWITSMLVSANKGFFIGTRKALNKYEYNHDEFSSCIVFNKSTDKSEFGQVNCIVQDKYNRLWVGTSIGLTYFSTNEFFDSLEIKYRSNSNLEIKAIEARTDTLWIATNKGLYVVNQSNIITLTKFQNTFPGSDSINVLFRSDSLYAATESGRRYRFDPKSKTFIQDRKFNKPITCMVKFDGVIYIGTQNINEQKEDRINKGLSDFNILSMFADRDSNLWIGTYIGGINRLISSRQQFKHYVSEYIKLSDNSLIRAIFESRNGIKYIGTSHGNLYRFNPKNNPILDSCHPIEKNDGIRTIAEDSQGILWIGTESGEIYLSNKNQNIFHKLKKYRKTKPIRFITYDGANTCLWVCTADSIYMINEQTKKVQSKTICKDAYHLYPDPDSSNTLWVGTLDGGLKRFGYNGQQLNLIIDNFSTFLTMSLITDIVSDLNNDSILWLGSSNGLIKFNKKKLVSDTVFMKDEFDKTMLSILQQNDSILWLHTTQGRLIRFNSKSYEKNYFTYRDGLQRGEGVGNSRLRTQEGWMLFGGSKGFNYFQPRSIVIPKKLPRPIFTEITSDKRDIIDREIDSTVDKKVITFDSTVTVQYRKGQTINIGFNVFDYFNSDQIHYWGKVEHDGQKTLYDFGTNEQSLRLINPNYGDYKITVWSNNGYSYSNKVQLNENAITLHIRARLDQKDWFRLLIIVLMIAGVVWIISKQIFKKKLAEKERISTDKENKLLLKQKKFLEEINAVENKEKILEEISRASLDLFGFDYISVSFVDYFSHTIKSEYSDSKNKELVNPDSWKEEGVLVIHGDIKNLSEYLELNEKNFKGYNHHELNRIFIPIFHSELKNPDDLSKGAEDIVIGVIEVGFHKSSQQDISDKLKQEYEFFINGCKESIYRTYRIDVVNEIEKISIMDIEIEDHKTYLNKLLESLINKFNVEIGEIFFLNFDNDLQTDKNCFVKTKNGIGKRLPLKRQKNSVPKGIVWQVITTGQPYITNNVKTDPNYFEETENTLSELAVPLIYREKLVGAINLESFSLNYFNTYKESIIEEIFKQVLPVYFNKKLDYGIQSLIKPFDRFSNTGVIHESIVKAVSNYFSSDLACLWVKDDKKDYDTASTGFTVVFFGSSEIETLIGNNKKIIIRNPEDLCEITPISSISDNKNPNIDNLFKILKDSELSSAILIPIAQEERIHGFITVFSKSDDIVLITEDRIYLKQISLKAGLTMSYANLYETFSDLGKALTERDQKTTIKRIVESAYHILGATNIVLIKYNSDLKKFTKDFECFGVFVNEEKYIRGIERKGLEDAWVVNRVIEEERLFLEPKEYADFLEQRSKYYKSTVFPTESFGQREGIKSMAAVALKQNDEILGVLFINYIHEQIFSTEFQSLIYTFASMASSALANIKYLELIKEKNKKLDEKVQIQEFEHRKIHKQMAEMLPLATQTSYFTILRGVTHDIRNLTIRMSLNAETIKIHSARLIERDRNNIESRIIEINNVIGNMNVLLNMFNFTKLKKENIDANKVIEDVLKLFKYSENKSIDFNTSKLQKNIGLIFFVKAEFSMIFYNIILNSIQAINKKKDKNANFSGIIKLMSERENDTFIFTIEDNGIGIKNENLTKIFNPGFTTNEGGTGIGLYFVSEILEENNGRITCESSYGDFARFQIKIKNSY